MADLIVQFVFLVGTVYLVIFFTFVKVKVGFLCTIQQPGSYWGISSALLLHGSPSHT